MNHPRDEIVAQARKEISEFVTDLAKERDLTVIEVMEILSEGLLACARALKAHEREQ